MTERFVSIASVPHRALGQPLVDLLTDHGISAYVNSDDCGGVDPALAFSNGTHVMVPVSAVPRAQQLVEEYENAPRLPPDLAVVD
jgi:hypothetical protein